MSCEIEMPKYQCHKIVWALKIKNIIPDGADDPNRETDGSAMIEPEDSRYAAFKVDCEYMRKHNPQVGGYYVVYEGGYKSYSPAEPFESGYSKV